MRHENNLDVYILYLWTIRATEDSLSMDNSYNRRYTAIYTVDCVDRVITWLLEKLDYDE